jgi:hypothetical protein
MVTMETDVEELLSLVITTGREIEEAVAQLQTMSQVVVRGVQQAQEELKKEAENQLWQEGILRYSGVRSISSGTAVVGGYPRVQQW